MLIGSGQLCKMSAIADDFQYGYGYGYPIDDTLVGHPVLESLGRTAAGAAVAAGLYGSGVRALKSHKEGLGSKYDELVGREFKRSEPYRKALVGKGVEAGEIDKVIHDAVKATKDYKELTKAIATNANISGALRKHRNKLIAAGAAIGSVLAAKNLYNKYHE